MDHKSSCLSSIFALKRSFIFLTFLSSAPAWSPNVEAEAQGALEQSFKDQIHACRVEARLGAGYTSLDSTQKTNGSIAPLALNFQLEPGMDIGLAATSLQKTRLSTHQPMESLKYSVLDHHSQNH